MINLPRYFLDQFKIGSRLLLMGNVFNQSSLQDVKYRIAINLMTTDIAMNQTFWVGIYPGLDKFRLNYIAEKIEEFFGIDH